MGVELTYRRLQEADALRGVAIVAMLISHAGPFLPNVPWLLDVVRSNINDLASPLFALVMGVSAQLLWFRSGRVARTVMKQSMRGVILVVLGMWMATWGSWIAIVLQPLGLLLIVGVPLLLFGTRIVLALALAVALISQPVVASAREHVLFFHSKGAAVTALAEWSVVGSSYRLINLLPFFLLGALLLRHGFRRDRVLGGMAVVAPIAYLAPLIAERVGRVDVRSGDYLDTLHDAGLVFAVYVAVVLLSTARARAAQRVWAAVSVPFRAWGQLALSLYVLHVGLIALWMRANGVPTENVLPGWLVIVPGVALVGWAWWRWVGTGPVEWLMGLVTGRRKKLWTARERAGSGAMV